jgi:hypothetical protein
MIFYGVYFSIVNTIGVEIEMDDLSCMEEIVHFNLGISRQCSSLSVVSATWGILRAKVKRRPSINPRDIVAWRMKTERGRPDRWTTAT